MGVRIDVFLSHDLPSFDDAAATIARLDSALPATLAVSEYWRSVDPTGREELVRWEVQPVSQRMANVRMYEGPGSLTVSVTPAAARISTGARWRGFLSIAPLRDVHLAAFRAIARAMGSATLAICSDARDEPFDAFMNGDSQETCIAGLRSALGPPQPSAGSIVPNAAHKIWFLEDAP